MYLCSIFRPIRRLYVVFFLDGTDTYLRDTRNTPNNTTNNQFQIFMPEIHPIPRMSNFKYSRLEIHPPKHTPNTTNQQFQIFTPLQLIKQVNCARIVLLVNRNENFFCCQLLCVKNKNSAFTDHHLQPNVDFGRDGDSRTTV